MGFEEDEARDNIEPVQSELDDGGLFSLDQFPQPDFRHTLTATPEIAAALEKMQLEGLTVSSIEGGKLEIALTGRTSDTLAEVYKQLSPAERETLAAVFAQHQLEAKLRLSPAQRGETFSVPRLMTEIQGQLRLPTPTSSWSLMTGHC